MPRRWKILCKKINLFFKIKYVLCYTKLLAPNNLLVLTPLLSTSRYLFYAIVQYRKYVIIL